MYIKLPKIFCDIQLIRINCIADGSCFIHAILQATMKKYIFDNTNRIKICRDVRNILADGLNIEYEKSGKTYYDTLGNGVYSEFAETNYEFKCSTMTKELYSMNFLDYKYLEYFTLCFNIDIYIIDINNKDIYNLGISDIETFYKKRNSIILIYDQNLEHFDLLGLEENKNIFTFFDPEHYLIKILYNYIINK